MKGKSNSYCNMVEIGVVLVLWRIIQMEIRSIVEIDVVSVRRMSQMDES